MCNVATIELQFPSQVLSPNSRASAFKKREQKRVEFKAAFFLVKQHLGDHQNSPLHNWNNTERIRMTLGISPPAKATAGNRDTDNVIASLKGAMDGLFKALPDVDDKQVRENLTVWLPKHEHGRILVRLEITTTTEEENLKWMMKKNTRS